MGEEFIEGQKGGVGVAGRGERLEQRRGQFGQPLARRGGARRGKAPEMPAAHRLGHGFWIGEAQTFQRREGLGVVLVAGEDQIAGP